MGAMKRKFEECCEENEYGDGVGWIRGRVLGKGSFGSVYKASRKDEFSSFPAELAVKSAEISVSSTLRDEKEIMRHLKGCDCLIECYGGETTVSDKGGAVAYNLLLEFCSGGSLADRIRERLPESEVRAYTESLLMGLCQIHAKGVVHCDLKPENILLVPKEGGGFRAKIGDFGLSKKKRKKSEEDGNCHWRGTPLYLSPESVTGRQQEAPADIWALGCVVLRMLTGKRPWEGQKQEILASIASENPEIPDSISDDARDFLMCCFEREPEWRPTAKSLLDHHPFVVDHCEDYDFEEDYESREDEFSCEEYESREDEYLDDGWMLSNKIEEDSSFASRLCPLKEQAFVGYPIPFPIAAGA